MQAAEAHSVTPAQVWLPARPAPLPAGPSLPPLIFSRFFFFFSFIIRGQVILRWALQHGVAIIPKSTRESRIVENAGVVLAKPPVGDGSGGGGGGGTPPASTPGSFAFRLSEKEMGAIDKLDRQERLCWKKDPLCLLDFD